MMNPAEFANIASAEQHLWWYRGMREILFRMIDPLASRNRVDRVLEAGCGTGYLSRLLAQRYGWKVTALDADPAGLCYALNSGTPSLVQGDIRALPFDSDSFDALISLDVIPHLNRGDERLAFEEFFRVLRPGGWLALRAPALEILRSRHSEFVHERQRFTRSQLIESLELAGFDIDRATYANSLLMPVALFKFRIWEPLKKQPPESGVQALPEWLDRLLYVPLQIEAGWIGIGGALPLGQSIVLIARKH